MHARRVLSIIRACFLFYVKHVLQYVNGHADAVYKFPLMWEKFTCTLYHFYDRGKYIWLMPLKALFICWSVVDILSFCSLRSAGNNHCNVQWKRIRIKKSVFLYRETNEDGRYIDFFQNKSLYWLEFEQNLDFNSHSLNNTLTLIVLICFQGGTYEPPEPPLATGCAASQMNN